MTARKTTLVLPICLERAREDPTGETPRAPGRFVLATVAPCSLHDAHGAHWSVWDPRWGVATERPACTAVVEELSDEDWADYSEAILEHDTAILPWEVDASAPFDKTGGVDG